MDGGVFPRPIANGEIRVLLDELNVGHDTVKTAFGMFLLCKT